MAVWWNQRDIRDMICIGDITWSGVGAAVSGSHPYIRPPSESRCLTSSFDHMSGPEPPESPSGLYTAPTVMQLETVREEGLGLKFKYLKKMLTPSMTEAKIFPELQPTSFAVVWIWTTANILHDQILTQNTIQAALCRLARPMETFQSGLRWRWLTTQSNWWAPRHHWLTDRRTLTCMF